MKNDKRHDASHSNKHEHFNKHEVVNKLIPLIENTAMRFNLIPIEIDFAKENHRWFLRIFIYAPGREVKLEDCENMSRSLEDFLEELIPVKYYLEISSPGIERKLKSDREYLVFRGKDIVVKIKNAIDETMEKQFIAKLKDFDENEGLYVTRQSDNKELLIKKDNIIYVKLYASDI